MARNEQGGETARRAGRRAGRGPTVADVARAAGVSPMTVSRTINADASVLPATRERVEDAIRHLGYVPNQAARSLAGGRQCRIALLHDNPSAAYLSELLVGCLAQASDSDAQLLVESYEGVASMAALARHLQSHRIDGVILPPPLCDDPDLLRALADAGLTMAQVATGRPSPLACAVSIDDRAAAAEMTRHLLGLGHRRIGFISGNANQTASALRREGYAAALEAGGVDWDDRLCAAGDFSYRSGLAAAQALLDLPVPPTAIFASNDDMAAAAVAVVHRRGLDVPRDLTVCGFDDTMIATTIWPELTTIRQPIAEMAREATKQTIAAVRAKRDSRPAEIRHERLEACLVRRLSDAGPPGEASSG